MALIKCSECGKEISDKAEICVNCGNPIQKIYKEEKNKQRKSFNELSKQEKQELVSIMKNEGLYIDGLITIMSVLNILLLIGLVSSLFTWVISNFKMVWYAQCGLIFCPILLFITIAIENIYGLNKAKRYYNDNVDIILVSRGKDVKKNFIRDKQKIIKIIAFIGLGIGVVFLSITIIMSFKKELQYDVSYTNTQETNDYNYFYSYTFKNNDYFTFIEKITDNKALLEEFNTLENKDSDYIQSLMGKHTITTEIEGSYYVVDNKIYLKEYDTNKEYECLIIKDNEIKCNNKSYGYNKKMYDNLGL